MARDLNAKCKYCRREGTKLFLKGERCYTSKCALTRRNYAPGVHGPKKQTRLTDFGKQLREKQKLKRTYGILESQLGIYFAKSSRKKGDTSQTLLQHLEMRLDNVVYRLGFVNSRALARQLVTHGHFLVDGKHVTIPSYTLCVGEVVSLKAKSLAIPVFINLQKNMQKNETPSWLSVDPMKMSGTIVEVPNHSSMKHPFDIKVVVEFYSR